MAAPPSAVAQSASNFAGWALPDCNKAKSNA